MASSDDAPKYNTPGQWSSGDAAGRNEVHGDAPSDASPAGGGAGGSDWRESLREAGPYLHLGWQFFGAILFFCGGGYLLDRQLGTSPWLTLVGAAVALAAILILVTRLNAEATQASEAKRKAKSNRPTSSYGSD